MIRASEIWLLEAVKREEQARTATTDDDRRAMRRQAEAMFQKALVEERAETQRTPAVELAR